MVICLGAKLSPAEFPPCGCLNPSIKKLWDPGTTCSHNADIDDRNVHMQECAQEKFPMLRYYLAMLHVGWSQLNEEFYRALSNGINFFWIKLALSTCREIGNHTTP